MRGSAQFKDAKERDGISFSCTKRNNSRFFKFGNIIRALKAFLPRSKLLPSTKALICGQPFLGLENMPSFTRMVSFGA